MSQENTPMLEVWKFSRISFEQFGNPHGKLLTKHCCFPSHENETNPLPEKKKKTFQRHPLENDRLLNSQNNLSKISNSKLTIRHNTLT